MDASLLLLALEDFLPVVLSGTALLVLARVCGRLDPAAGRYVATGNNSASRRPSPLGSPVNRHCSGHREEPLPPAMALTLRVATVGLLVPGIGLVT
jgi:hypothetical protein